MQLALSENLEGGTKLLRRAATSGAPLSTSAPNATMVLHSMVISLMATAWLLCTHWVCNLREAIFVGSTRTCNGKHDKDDELRAAHVGAEFLCASLALNRVNLVWHPLSYIPRFSFILRQHQPSLFIGNPYSPRCTAIVIIIYNYQILTIIDHHGSPSLNSLI